MEKAQNFLNRRLVKLALSLRFSYGLVILLSFLGGLLVIAQAAVLSQVIGQVFLGKELLAQVSPYLWVFAGILLGRSILTFISEGLAGQCAIQIKTRLRERLFRHFFELGPAALQGKASGDLAARALQGIENLDGYFSQYLPQVVLAAVLPISILIFVFPLDLLSGIILLVTAPLIAVFMYLIGEYAESLTKRQFAALSRLSAVFLDTIQGLAALKAMSQSQARAKKIRVASENYRAATLGVLRVTFLSALVLELVGTLSTAIVAVEIGLRLLNSQLDFYQAFFILVIAPEFYLPLRQLGLRFHASTAGLSAARAIFEVLDQQAPGAPVQENTKETGGSEIFSSTSHSQETNEIEVTIKDVTFTYPDRGQEALQNASFTIRPFEITALVGSSGSGKSTIAQLLLRFIEPQAGQILINQRPLVEYGVRQWRSLVAWAPQQPYLFQASLAENIRLARPSASMEEVRRAASQAELDDFVQYLPAGYDTLIGERGTKLSGGQAQRVALARAFLKDAPLLVLDEPEANLDPELSERIQTSLRRLCQGRTVLIIGHRLQALREVGQIIVLENGKVVESGSHDVLLAKGGVYSRLVAQGGNER